MKKIITALFCLFLLHSVSAQIDYEYENLPDSLRQPVPYQFNYFTFSPLNLLEIEPSFQFGYEYNLRENKVLRHEVAYVGFLNGFYNAMRATNWNVSPESIEGYGFKVRTTFKKYLTDPNLINNNRFRYIGIDAMYKYFVIEENEVQIQRLGGAYSEIYDFNWQKHVGAIHFVYGGTSYLSVNSNVTIDSFIGIGLRNKYIIDNIPKDVEYTTNWYDDTFDGMMVSIMMGIKLNFGL